MTEKLNIKQLKPVSTDVNLGTSDALLPTQNAVKTYVDTADSGLQTQIDALSGRGRFLSVWNCVTGLPETEPETSPYEYKAGDYYIVGVVSSATPAVNYKPDGTEYVSGVASTTLETSEVSVNDTYLYDGENWVLQSNAQKEVSFSALAGSPYDNTNLSNALNAKANNTNRVNGAPLSNTASAFYGTSTTAAATIQKEVSIPSITTLDTGTIIIVQPTTTSTVANSTLKLNGFPAYPMRYNNAAITTSTDSIVWNAAFPSIWVFDGTYWVFAGHGVDSNTTYSAMSVAEGTTGTATSNRVMTAANTKQIIQGTTLTGIDVATTGAVSASDTITEGIGKLQATKADKTELPTVNNPTITITQGGVTKGSFTLNQASGDTIALDAGGGSIAWGNITGTLANQTDLQNALNTKQNTLTAGDGIDITSNIISVNNIDCGTMS